MTAYFISALPSVRVWSLVAFIFLPRIYK